MTARVVRVLTGYRTWLGLATLLFSAWYTVFLFPFRTVEALASLASFADGALPLVPAVGAGTLRATVGLFVNGGLPLTVIAFAVGFGLYHRQAETA